jgi:hypothetical protein
MGLCGRCLRATGPESRAWRKYDECVEHSSAMNVPEYGAKGMARKSWMRSAYYAGSDDSIGIQPERTVSFACRSCAAGKPVTTRGGFLFVREHGCMDMVPQLTQSLHALCELVASELQFAPLAGLIGLVSTVGTAALEDFTSKKQVAPPSVPPRL